MNRAMATRLCRTFTVASLIAPILVTWLYVGACGPRKRGVVVSAHLLGVSVSAAWCSGA